MNAGRSVAASSILLALAVSGCFYDSDLEWTEDVRLPDGRIIALKRKVEFKGGSSHLGDPSTESRQWLEFSNPATGKAIRWSNDQEHGLLRTIALWFDGKTPMLLTKPAYGGDLIKFGCPNPPYLLYEYVSDDWRSKPLAQISIKQIRSNMTSRPLEVRRAIEGSRYHLDVEQTANSYTFHNGTVPYLITFVGMPEQTFRKYANCDKPLDNLLMN